MTWAGRAGTAVPPGQLPQRPLRQLPQRRRISKRLHDQAGLSHPGAERLLPCPNSRSSVAVSNSSSVYDIPGSSRTGDPYRVPSIPTYTSHDRTRSWHSWAGT